MAALTVEELLEQLQQSRARPDNISYFAFTGTPRHSTLMLFGRPADPSQKPSKDNLPHAFHRYRCAAGVERTIGASRWHLATHPVITRSLPKM